MTELAHERRGSGPPLVLIHGLGSHRRVWAPIVATLARHRDVIALDLPGFGDSPPAESTAHAGSVAHFADEVASFLGRLGVTGPEVAGSSLGGAVALELGRRGCARAVTAFAPIGFWSATGRRWCQGVVTAARATARRLDPRLPAVMASDVGRAALCSLFHARPLRLDPADAVAAARALAHAPGFAAARDALGDLPPWRHEQAGAPVTIAWGTRDAVLPFAQSRRARRVLPAARHLTLRGCGHLPFADDPEACAAAVLSAAAR